MKKTPKAENLLEYVFLEDKKLLEFCKINTTRGSGKGGQKKDKTSNCVQLSFSHFHTSCHKYRLQKLNQKTALQKLRKKIALDRRPEERTIWKEVPLNLKAFLQDKKILIQENNKHYPFFLGFWNDILIQSKTIEQLTDFLQVSKSQIYKWDKKNHNLLRKFILKKIRQQ